MPALTRCLIANRGEIAVRLMRACREHGISPVAVYSAADADAPHVRMADAAVHLGDPAPGESYLHIQGLIAAAQASGCDCVHPGYGFLSESPDFAQAVIDAGLVWVGPPPDVIALMGVKTAARARMQAAGVPLAPGFASDEADIAAFTQAAERIGYPVMVKAAGGGGGKGIRVVRDPAGLAEAVAAAQREARHAFGDGRVFLEKFIERARHIEVQVIADSQGRVLHLFERECSVQRRHQKIIEESPSPLLDDTTRQRICTAAVTAAEAVGYVNAGTVEFIADESGAFYFLEMNTRLQVEHPVTECVTGLDIVALQLMVAAGEPLPLAQADIRQTGHAIECRLYAEDAANGFLPATGPVLRFVPPGGAGVRVDAGVQTGDTISMHYDPMVAKLIVHAPTRDMAIQRMRRALDETVLLGTTTNLDFLRALLDAPDFVRGAVHTTYIDAHLSRLLPDAESAPDVALIAAAIADHARAQVAGSGAAAGDGSDRYSPWSRTDGFRLGKRGESA